MKWKENLIDNEDALVKALNKRIGAIKKISKVSSFKTRKILTNGIFYFKADLFDASVDGR
jgi:hypothetical protein